MAINYPTSLDNFTNPTSTDQVASVTVPHATQHANANDAIEALEAKVGADGSAVTTSHDYKLGEVISTDKAVGKTATQTLTNKTLTSPTITNKTSTGTDNGTETLVNKTLTSPTLTTPTIASFVNAGHNHQDAAGGGTLSESALALTDVTTNDVSTTKHGFVPKAPNNTSTYLRGDGTWSTISGVTKFGGTGADGALTITSGATNIDLGGAQVVIKNYSSISITGTASLTFTNPHANGTIVILKSQGNVTITSSTNPAIDVRGIGGNYGSAVFGNSNLFFTSNGGTSGTNNSNATGGTGGAAGVLFSKNALYYKNVLLCVGAGGGNGGGYDGSGFTGFGGGGGGGGASAINSGTAGSNGGNIGGGNTSTAVNGGRGGGALYIECAGSYSASSTINASGQNGSAATFSNGGGGAGGCIFILYNTLTSNTGTYTVAGGTGGAGSGAAGGNGGAGYTYVGLNTEFQ